MSRLSRPSLILTDIVHLPWGWCNDKWYATGMSYLLATASTWWKSTFLSCKICQSTWIDDCKSSLYCM